jgi:hypothetical protein
MFPRRINRKMPWRFAAAGMSLDPGECSVRLVDAESGDAVVAAVGNVEESARGVYGDFGRRGVAFEIRRQRGK